MATHHQPPEVRPLGLRPLGVSPLGVRPLDVGIVSKHHPRTVMWTGSLELDLLLGDVGSLKEKRAVVRPLLAELRRLAVSAAEVDHLDLHRRTTLGVAVVAADRAHVVEVLDAAERLAAGRPDAELLSARRVLRTSEDD